MHGWLLPCWYCVNIQYMILFNLVWFGSIRTHTHIHHIKHTCTLYILRTRMHRRGMQKSFQNEHSFFSDRIRKWNKSRNRNKFTEINAEQFFSRKKSILMNLKTFGKRSEVFFTSRILKGGSCILETWWCTLLWMDFDEGMCVCVCKILCKLTVLFAISYWK